jgi:hypothetical protein
MKGTDCFAIDISSRDTINGITAPWYKIKLGNGKDDAVGWVFGQYVRPKPDYIEGKVSSMDCGDNCYIDIVDENGKVHSAGDATGLDNKAIGKRVRVRAQIDRFCEGTEGGKCEGVITVFYDGKILD